MILINLNIITFIKPRQKKLKKEHGEFYLFSSNFGFLNKQNSVRD